MLRAKTKELFAMKCMLAGLINPSVNVHLIFPEVAERAEVFFAGEEVDSHFKEKKRINIGFNFVVKILMLRQVAWRSRERENVRLFIDYF